MRRDTLGLLEDIRDAARFIAEDTAGATFEAFMGDRPMRQLVAHNFEIIGEAVRAEMDKRDSSKVRVTK